jgi:hypothetical protein
MSSTCRYRRRRYEKLLIKSLQQHHHLRDVICGTTLGLLFGSLAYRSSYASLLDPRFNHLPLPPQTSQVRFSYKAGEGIAGWVGDADSLVFWDWWKLSGAQSGRKEKETSALLTLQAVAAIGKLVAPALTPGKQRRQDGSSREIRETKKETSHVRIHSN